MLGLTSTRQIVFLNWQSHSLCTRLKEAAAFQLRKLSNCQEETAVVAAGKLSWLGLDKYDVKTALTLLTQVLQIYKGKNKS